MTGNLASWTQTIGSQGAAVWPSMFSPAEVRDILRYLEDEPLRRSRAGVRHALQSRSVAALAKDPRLGSLAAAILGPGAVPYRATLFDKSENANWLVVWHQDTALPLEGRADRPGWGPWSVKEGIAYAHAPEHALSQILALRIHLDDSTSENGPLRALSATHTLGVLSDDRINDLASNTPPLTLLVAAGGVIGMRPLLVHASSKSQSQAPRRVLHIEYSAVPEFDGLRLAIA